MTDATLSPAAAPAVVGTARTGRSAKQRRARRTRWIWAAALWILAIAFLAPFAWMLSTSLKTNADAFTIPMEWIPDPLRWDSFVAVLTGPTSIVPAFANSVIVATARVLGEVLTATMAGYAFARLHFRGRDKIFLAYLATSIIPAQLLLVPRFIYFQQMGLYDTLWALILPGMFTVLGTFLMRQFFVAQPSAFAEAARIDGANEWQIFWRLYLPMATPVMSALGILAFVWSWNDYETPLVLISSPEAFTLPLSLTNFTDEQGSLAPNLSMAASVVSIIPVLIVFLLLQKRFVHAMTHTGIK
ncbi:binding-protein-dependent transport systems inner membrane component [Beutenbergia cavernae DSM 12333]|uniref:Binding-protein-dependent transport systems inner membrane component n=1 Tax=Beutenbergia cavernae (strain ATCC BAA-8 / DSM 12333 / CCUG 43141 / JCM 11478 / NBRC 16432 / NCIMB 13614 / HKI 0122) TaxID=471853 RepID=C5BWC6_BEUC1|nr:carbohydrate ABC transporter permease [Beutenbergia cavernae]ACQ78584.1 binding-protein-dependent transport systems inner membrane component [Beutenbergia cavernae DSM 12333]